MSICYGPWLYPLIPFSLNSSLTPTQSRLYHSGALFFDVHIPFLWDMMKKNQMLRNRCLYNPDSTAHSNDTRRELYLG